MMKSPFPKIAVPGYALALCPECSELVSVRNYETKKRALTRHLTRKKNPCKRDNPVFPKNRPPN